MPETEWDDEQQGWMLALHDLEADQCPGCSGPLSETTRPEMENAYTVPDPTRCHRCTAISVKQEGYRKVPQLAALLWTAITGRR